MDLWENDVSDRELMEVIRIAQRALKRRISSLETQIKLQRAHIRRRMKDYYEEEQRMKSMPHFPWKIGVQADEYRYIMKQKRKYFELKQSLYKNKELLRKL
jgi:hypothetical protein